MNLTLRRSASRSKTRFQNRIVAQAVIRVLNYQLVSNSEKGCAFFVETFSKVHLIFERQFSFGMATDFVEHSAEIKQVADLVVGTTNTQLSHTGAHFRGPWGFIASCEQLYGTGRCVLVYANRPHRP